MSRDLPRARRLLRPVVLVVVVLGLLASGAGVAALLGDALGLTSEPADVPPEDAAAAALREPVAAPRLDTIAVPAGSGPVAVAAEALADALADAGASRPAVGATPSDATPSSGRRTLAVRITRLPATADETRAPSPERYRTSSTSTGHQVDAATAAGAMTALRVLADLVRSGRELFPSSEDGRVVAPRLGLRMIDTGAVGLDDDPARFAAGEDYTLNSDVVGSAVLPDPPYVDTDRVTEIAAQFRTLVDHGLAQGYNAVVVPGFLEYVTFAGVGDGHEVYPEGDPHPARAEAMAEAFEPVWRYAHDQGLRVYFATDMLAVSPPLEDYLDGQGGDVEDADFWRVYQEGIRELMATMPFASGLMVRIGEGGSAYAMDGWDFSSKIEVTTATAVQTMLRSFLQVADETDTELIFRSWTVGVGPVGDLHTNATSYDTVLGDLDDPRLIVSTKYSAGDFYSQLPLNTTLERGPQRRVVELQARREYEGLGSLPDDLGDLTQTALQQFLARNPQVEGVWTWTQTGGPLYAGPRSLYLRDGFWQLADLNAYVFSRLAHDPSIHPSDATADWIRATFSSDPATVRALGEVFAASREAVLDGLYVGPFADRTVRALGLEPPPMMWIFEWDLVSGDSAALDSIYAITRGQVDEAIAEGDRAVETTGRMRSLVERTDAADWHDPALRERLIDTLDYEQDLFRTLGAYRATFLRHTQWLDTGSSQAHDQWRTADEEFRAARAEHTRRYGDDLDLPAYNFTAADLGTARAERDPAMAWVARSLAVVLGLLLAAAVVLRRRRVPGLAAVRALVLGALAPWRLSATGPASRVDRVVVWALPAVLLVASRAALTWFSAPAHLLVTLGSWLLFALTLRLLLRGRDPYALWAVVGGIALLRTVVLLVALVARGPGRYWLLFWTDPSDRGRYVTIAFAAFCWLFVATGIVLRRAYGVRVLGVLGRVALAAGVPLVVFGTFVGLVGLEQALTTWNDQMMLLPWGLSRILGLTVHLGIPTALPWFVAAAGAALVLSGVGGTLLGRRAR
ncbi:hypothetical protein [Mumia sp. Pv 4-285]|uniref:hypothetical protein n=1 Tax=Mumia qirimensis TaxID=3234852 RepID=UPI00351CC926